jgi:micrococcal nuclease
MLYYTRIVIIFFLTLLIANTAEALPGRPYVVTAIHDGDTISVRVAGPIKSGQNTDRLRLIGIDAPEMRQGKWGHAAKKRLKNLIGRSSHSVNLELDIEHRDKYGRLLGYIWSSDGSMLNEQMVEEGYAVLYTVPPNVRYSDRFIRAEKKARGKRLGIWGPDGLRQKPSDWRKENPYDRPLR